MEALHPLACRDLSLSMQNGLQILDRMLQRFDRIIQLLEILNVECANAEAHSEPIPPVERCIGLACAIKPKKAALLKFDSRIGKCFTLSVDDIPTSRILIPFKLTATLPLQDAIYPQLQSKTFHAQARIIDPIFSYLAMMAAYT
jgi:hypothetical protein